MTDSPPRTPPSASDSTSSPATSYLLDELTWVEAGRTIARDPRLIFPVGAVTQHGPHLPMGTNTIIAESLAHDVSAELRILCAPALRYGVPPASDRDFPGAAGIRRKTMHRAMNELLAAWEDHGVSEFIIVTAHRHEPHLEAILMALTAKSRTTVIDLYGIDVGDILESNPEAEIAGEMETSLLLHLAPHLVRQERVSDAPLGPKQYRKYVRGRLPTPPPGSSGTIGHPSRASARKGQLLFERYRSVLREALAGADAE